jgi:HlyD family secretion protein
VQNVVTYDAVIDVGNSELKLKPGMTANVTFIYAEKSDVLRVPNAALRFRPPADLARAAPSGSSSAAPAPSASAAERPRGQRGGGAGRSAPVEPDVRTVWVLDGPEPRPVVIHTGITDGSLTEVTDGDLHAGDALVTEITGGEPDKPSTGASPGATPPAGGLRRIF